MEVHVQGFNNDEDLKHVIKVEIVRIQQTLMTFPWYDINTTLMTFRFISFGVIASVNAVSVV